MHSALIVVNLDQDGRKLDAFFAKAKAHAAQGKNVERLSENVWLVNVQTDFHVFSKILAAAESQQLAFRTLLHHDATSGEEFQWLPVNQNP